MAALVAAGSFFGSGWTGTPAHADQPMLGAQRLDAPALPPEITQHPSDSTYAKDATARFYVQAASPDGGYLSYQWYRSQAYDETAYAAMIAAGISEGAIQGSGKPFEPGSDDFGGNMDADGSKSVLTCETPEASGVNHYFYWVTVTNHKDVNGDGDAEDTGEEASEDSLLADVKVVDRTLPAQLQNGDFEHWYMPGGITDKTTVPSTTSQDNTFYAQETAYDASGHGWIWTGGEYDDTRDANHTDAYNGFYTTHDLTLGGQLTYRGTTPAKGGYIEIGTPSRMYGLPDAGHGSYTAELNANKLSSLYQTIATVPGKIYEWSLDYGTRSIDIQANIAKMRLAVVIGDALNGKADYNAGTTNRYLSDIYPYGQNDSSYFYDIVGQIANPSAAPDGVHTVDYNGSTYYVYLATIDNTAAANQRGKWFPHSGAYSVPAGQGETVFGFVGMSFNSSGASVANTSGNNLDNITFKSGTDPGAAADTTYSGETKITAPTQPGYAYGLAELRGSALQDLTGLSAYYDADGDGSSPEQSIQPSTTLGAGGWYARTKDGEAFAAGGVITFRNLTPGKTYRLVGIPEGAISVGLGTNLSPCSVLDEGYYSDSRILAASAGGDKALPSYDLEVYEDKDAPGSATERRRVRVTLQNADPMSQYAILAEDPDNTGHPDTSGPALPGASWTAGASGLTFDGLHLSKSYYLVARPLGYTEIGYAEASYVDGATDADGNSPAHAWVEIKTPVKTTEDVDASSVRRPSGTSVIVSNIGDARMDYTYALADVSTGKIVGGPYDFEDVTDKQLTFSGLDETKAYQVVTKLTVGGAYLWGVRVYPYPASFVADYASESIRSAAGSGAIPGDTEYIIRPSDKQNIYLAGHAPAVATGSAVYERGTGSTAIDLNDPSVSGSAVGSSAARLSLFDALKAASSASFRIDYRHSASADAYEGAYVLPELTLTLPGRPQPPASGTDFALDYPGEKIGASSSIEARGASAAWTKLAPGGSVTFGDLGWTGAAEQKAYVRKQGTAGAFASFETEIPIAARGRAPDSISAELTQDDKFEPIAITLGGFDTNEEYEYRRGADDAWKTVPPTSYSALGLPYSLSGVEYEVRYPATASSPASLYATVSSPLNIVATNFGSYPYGGTIPPMNVTIRNITTDNITLSAIEEEGWGTASVRMIFDGGAWCDLNTTGAATVLSRSALTDVYRVTPKTGLPAGNYAATFEARYSYTYGEGESAFAKSYVARANIYLTVAKAERSMSGASAQVSDVKQDSFTVTVTNAPTDANLLFSLGGGDWKEAAAGQTAYTFTGLAPARTYSVSVKAAGDANHSESAPVQLATAHTLQATPDAGSVLNIDYANERVYITPAPGSAIEDYTVKATQNSQETSIAHGASLTSLAEAGDFTLSVSRNASGDYGQSAAAELPLSGKVAAPSVSTNANTSPATTGKTADGSINNLSGVFQYRVHREGDVTSGWTTAVNAATVPAGLYDVRRPPTTAGFASKIASLRVGSKQPMVTLQTKTYVPTGSSVATLPDFIQLGATGWRTLTGAGEEGQYQHDKTAAYLPLPSVVTSRSHVFGNWYNNEEFTGDPVSGAPGDGGNIDYSYYAKWLIRPSIESVKTSSGAVTTDAAVETDSGTAAKGLTPGDPVKVSVRLAPGDNTIALSDIKLTGQAISPAAGLYHSDDTTFSNPVTGNATVYWRAAPTKFILITTSADDVSTKVYYELDVYATRIVQFTAQAADGEKDKKTSTHMTIAFTDAGSSANVNGLTADGVTLTDATGSAVKNGPLSGKDPTATYDLPVKVSSRGAVNVRISDWSGYKVSPPSVYAELYRDVTPPEGEVAIRGNTFRNFLNTITFGLFFKENVDVKVTPSDPGGDGVAKTELYLMSSEYSSQDAFLQAIASGEIAPEKTQTDGEPVTLQIQPNSKGSVYAKITDKADNISVINSEGVAVYTDSALADGESGEITYTKMSKKDSRVNVKYSGNSIEKIVNDMGTPSDDTDDVTLTRGTSYAAAGEGQTNGAVTISGIYLDSLAASDAGKSYILNISYKPLGETYVPNLTTGGIDQNDSPTKTAIHLTVKKAKPEITLGAEPETPSYGQNNVSLTADVTTTESAVKSPVPATGTVTFHAVGKSGSAQASDALDSGEADVSLTLSAGAYTLRAEYAGDANYAAGEALSESYTVKKAAQEAPIVKEGGQTAGPVIEKSRESGSFTLTASGGLSGNYVWSATPQGVVTITTSGAYGAAAGFTIVSDPSQATQAAIKVYREEDANHEKSTVTEITLKVAKEKTPPVPGSPRAVTVSPGSLTQNSLTLKWTDATDNFTTKANILYKVYLSPNDDISTLELCRDKTPLNPSGTRGITSYAITDLTPDTPYWLNVVAEDEAGNQAAYAMSRVITPVDVRVTSAVQQGGRNGRDETTGILLTFDRAVTGLDTAADAVTVSGAGVRRGAVEDAGNTGGRTWLVPVQLSPDAVNGDLAGVRVSGWTDGANSHHYDVTNTEPVNVTLYAPVIQPTPGAAVDYVNRGLTGLANSGALYRFAITQGALGSYEWGNPVTADAGGKYSTMPFGFYGGKLYIQRMGTNATAAAISPGSVNSAVQTLDVPARPAAPQVDVTQPTTTGGLGSVTVTNASEGARYEYAAESDYTSSQGSSGGYDAKIWTVTGPAVGSTLTVGAITPGAYVIRVKAVEGNSFASVVTNVHIFPYRAVGFPDVLEGYSVVSDNTTNSALDVNAWQIMTDGGEEIESVTWSAIGGATTAFAITTGSAAGSWYIKPLAGLSGHVTGAGIYSASIDVKYKGVGETSTRDVSFTVHPKAEITSAAITSVQNRKGGLSDTLTLTFTYPINLDIADVIVAGAAVKPQGAAFLSTSADKKTYQIPIVPNLSNRTGDSVSVTVKLNAHDGVHSFQISKAGGDATITPKTAPTVTIPRAITEARAITAAPGYATGIIQFTLSSTMSAVADPGLLDYWTLGNLSPSPVSLGGTAEVTIAAIYYIHEDKTEEGYLTFRMFVIVTKGGSATISVPALGINEPFPVTGGLQTGPLLEGAAYFVSGKDADGKVHDYDTDLNASQKLPALDFAGMYAAPEHALPTNLEYSTSASAVIHLYEPGAAAGRLLTPGRDYTITSGGAARYVFSNTPTTFTAIANQLVLKLNSDWTRRNGTHRIVAVMNDGGAASPAAFGEHLAMQASIPTEGITTTYALSLTEDAGGAGAWADSHSGIPADTPTTSGAFASGAAIALTATPDTAAGYKFGSWRKIAGPDITLPAGAAGTFTMPGAPVTLQAIYIDGTPPESEISPQTGSWIASGAAIRIAATDKDPAKTASEGAVSAVKYRIDGDAEQIVSSSKAAFTLPSDGAHQIEYWAVDRADNEERPHKTATIGRDSVKPSGVVTVRKKGVEFGGEYEAFHASPEFSLFYRDAEVDARAVSSDTGGSGVKTTEYFKIATSGAVHSLSFPADEDAADAAALTAGGWKSTMPAIGKDEKAVLYVRITDGAGNRKIINTQGIVNYSDAAPTAPGIWAYAREDADKPVTVAMKGSSVSKIVNDMGTAAASDDVTLTKDRDYDVDYTPGTVTFKGAYLKGLAAKGTTGAAADGYTLTLSYNPQGENFSSAAAISDTPGKTQIELDVLKAKSSVELKISPAPQSGTESEATYDPSGCVTLTAIVTNASFAGGAAAGGVVSFYDEKKDALKADGTKNPDAVSSSVLSPAAVDLIGTAAAVNGVATLKNAVLPAGGRDAGDLYAVYAGDGNYHAGAGALNDAYKIAKAAQSAPALSGGGITGNGAAYALTTTYGAAAQALTALGAQSAATGRYLWDDSDDSAVAGAAQSATDGANSISINGAGAATIKVTRDADRNYLPSPVSALYVSVAKRPVMITGVKAKDKIYDGQAAAEVDWSGARLDGVNGDPGTGPVQTDYTGEGDSRGLLGIDRRDAKAAFTGGGTPDVADHPEYAGTGKTVSFEGFELSGTKRFNYSLVGQPKNTTADITKAAPAWQSAALTGTAIRYGQTLAESAVSHIKAKGVAETALSGAVRWTEDGTIVPGFDDLSAAAIGLPVDGYEYSIIFEPEAGSVDAVNYTTLTSRAAVWVDQAVATASAVRGTTILPAQYLSESAISGIVTFRRGANDAERADNEGDRWAWADGVDTSLTGGALAAKGQEYTTLAAFTPGDRRIAPLTAPATLLVTSPVADIATWPAIAPMDYGSFLRDNGDKISDDGVVLWRSDDVGLAEDITSAGAFSWGEPGMQILSKTGTQSSVPLVFTPYDTVLYDVTGAAFVRVPVSSIDPAPSAPATAPAVTIGSQISSFDLPKNGGYTFSGAVIGGERESVPGTLAWLTPDTLITAGALDGNGNDPKDGWYVAKAVFTPEPGYSLAYKKLTFDVRVRVNALPETVEILETDAEVAKTDYGKVSVASENYAPEAIEKLQRAIAAAEKAVAEAKEEGIPQSLAEQLARDIADALSGLAHYHPEKEILVDQKPANIIDKEGQSIRIGIQGRLSDVRRVTLNGTDLSVTDVPGPLYLNGQNVGTLTDGSAVVSLHPAYLDTLANGPYEVRVFFDDGYMNGWGEANFVIARPAPTKEDPPEEKVDDVRVNGVRIHGAVSGTTFRYKAGGVGNSMKLGADVSVSGNAPGNVLWTVRGPARIADGLVSFTGAEGTVVATATSGFDESKKDFIIINVVKNVTAIRAPVQTVYVQRGKSFLLPVALDDSSDPTRTISSKLRWKSSNPSVLTVSQKGWIRANKKVKKKTKVTVSVTAADGLKKNITVCIVPKAKKLKKVSAKFPKTMKVGKTFLIKVKLRAATATGVKVTFRSSKRTVIKVDRAGKIVALKKGSATITVKAGKKSIRKKVTVR